jgi:hypothetical protein
MYARQALVVRNAPSRWIASIFFQSAIGEIDRAVNDLDAGIADEDIDLAVFGDDRRRRPYRPAPSSGHVHRDRESVAMLRLDLVGGRLRGIEIEIGDDGNAAFGRKA